MTATTTIEPPGGGLAWYSLSARDVTAQMGVDADAGLTVAADKLIQLSRQRKALEAP